jgi:hypothetical protein
MSEFVITSDLWKMTTALTLEFSECYLFSSELSSYLSFSKDIASLLLM